MGHAGRANVLLVDDRPENLLALEQILQPLDQNLVKAGSGDEALRCLLREDFAVILLDVKMPGLDGLETASRIKQRERSRHIPIIFLTAVSREPGEALQGYSAGAVDYLSKPFEPEVLLSKVSVFVDLYLERRRAEVAERTLLHQAFHDELTQLPNRALLLERLSHALAGRGRRAGDIAVLFLDIDRLKWVNDSLGHPVGDELLVAVAERLKSAVRPDDTVARFGGDEFVVVCEELDGEGSALAVAERLVGALALPFALKEHKIVLTVSVGIACAAAKGEDTADALLRDADTAMYQAKERGRDAIELFDQGMRSRALARLDTARALRRAVDQGELRVFYQPVLELAGQRVAGVEALLRWEHPERGLVLPGEFVAVAEETTLILPIGEFVLTEACSQVARWNQAHPDRPPLTAAVNLSARQLVSRGMATLVAEALDASGLDPGRLCLEITESVLMEDAGSSRSALDALKALGVTIAVDDFGTGYSSLLYLRRFPVDLVKVDRSFVAGLGQSPEDSAIVAGVVGLAKALGLAAVAEGVESPEQAARLVELGCDLAQGYLWSPALPPRRRANGWRPPSGRLRRPPSPRPLEPGCSSPTTTARCGAWSGWPWSWTGSSRWSPRRPTGRRRSRWPTCTIPISSFST